MIIIDIIYNLAILVAFSVLSGFLQARYKRDTMLGKILQGLLFGTVSLIGMMNPFVFAEGLIFDGRSVVLSLCALFFGPIAGLIAGLMAATLRIYMGGMGAITGVSVITAAVAIGIAFNHYWRNNKIELSTKNLYLMGLVVHIVMLILMFTLPSNFRLITLQTIGITVISIYPLATILIGRILKDQYDNLILMDNLKERDEKYKLITEHSKDVIWIMDFDLKLKFISPSVKSVYGFEADEYMKLPVLKTMTEESYFNVMSVFQEELQKEQLGIKASNWRIIETEEYRKDGSIIFIEAKMSYVRDENQNPVGIVGISRDVTERKNAEIALKESEEKYRLIIQNVNDLIVKVDKDGQFLFVSPTYCEMFGKTEKELIGKSFMPLVHEDDQDTTAESIKKLNEAPHTCYIEQRAMTAKGWRWLAWSDSAIFDSKGDVSFIIGVGRDITDRVEYETALKESEALFKTIVENIPFHFLTFDTDDVITYQNKSSVDFWGSMKSKKLDDIRMHPKIKEQWLNDNVSVFAGDTVKKTETIEKNGTIYYFDKIAVPIITGFEISGAISVSVDINERMALLHTEKRYRQLIENISQEYFIYQEDTNHKFQYISPSVYHILGFEPEELIGKSLYGGILSDNELNDFADKNTHMAYDGAKIPPYRVELVHKDGSRRWIEVSEAPVCDTNGKVIALDGIAKDITDKFRYDEAIQKQVLALTRPIDDASDITFTELFNIDEIQNIQDLFAEATKVASIITEPDGTPITKPSRFSRLCNDIIRNTEIGLKNCYHSDSMIGGKNPDGPTMQPCLSGSLWDAGASIVVGGKHIANWLIGQVRTDDMDFDKLLEYADVIGANKDEFRKALEEIPIMTKKEFENISSMLYAVASELSLKAYQNIQQARFISELNRTKEAMLQSEQTFQTIFQTNASMMVVSSFDDGIIKDANSSFLNTLEYSRDELIGQSSLDIDIWANADDKAKIIKTISEKGRIRNFETQLLTGKGETRFVSYSADIIRIDKNKYILSVMLDITDRKQAEEELLKLNIELESIVAARTEELSMTMNQLQDSNMELQALNEQMISDSDRIIKLNEELSNALASKDKFFSIIAHDLKNPFVALLNNSEMLLNYFDKINEDKKKEMIFRIKEASQSTYALLENLLQWSRSQMGRIEPKPFFVNMFDLAFKTMTILRSQASVKNVTVEIKIPAVSYVFCDSEMVLAVLRNIISNAIKFSNVNSTVEVGITDMVVFPDEKIKSSKKTKPFSVYYVKDSGIGMDPYKLDRLFKLDDTIVAEGTSGEKGTGLGLVICKEFIDKHKGTIWVESKLGEGTTIYFSLPMN